MAARRHIPLKVKLACALLEVDRLRTMVDRHRGNPSAARLIQYDDAKTLTPEQIIARWHFDHYPIPHAEGGTDHPSNLTPRPAAEHREKTAHQDVPGIAKRKRLARKQAEHEARMTTPVAWLACSAPTEGAVLGERYEVFQTPKRKRKIASRPFPKGHRPMRRKP